ncbi:hypothetical protein ACOTVF_08570, partial [Campylobacter jejuni]|uniref:hypothetical protein n=1 Tax=Campylobacter jejuni TaxID=197 RepID=UPI003B9DDA42
MKNIVLLGGSHSVMADGLQKGLRSGVLKLNEESTIFNFYNFAIGGCTSIQNLYEVVRHRHILNNADLIITESNINEIYNHYFIQNMPLKLIYRDLNWFYKELYFLNKKIIVIILAENIIKDGDKKNVAIINNIHRKLSYKFGFNIIDFDRYYFDKNLYHFSKLLEPGVHQCSIILRELGLSIMDNIKSFSKSKISSIKNDNPHFKIITPKNMKLIKGNIPSRIIHNAMYKEKVYRLNYFTKLQFPIELNGYFILGLHGWNNEMEEQIKHKGWNERIRTYSSIVIYNEHNMITKEVAFLNQFINLNNIIFVLKDENFLEINKDNSRIFSELCVNVETWHNDSIQIDFCDLIGFLLASPEGNYYTEEIDFEALANENIKIPEEYDFN